MTPLRDHCGEIEGLPRWKAEQALAAGWLPPSFGARVKAIWTSVQRDCERDLAVGLGAGYVSRRTVLADLLAVWEDEDAERAEDQRADFHLWASSGGQA